MLILTHIYRESPKESFAKSVSLLKDKVLMTVNEMSSAFANGKQEQAIESTAAESNTGELTDAVLLQIYDHCKHFSSNNFFKLVTCLIMMCFVTKLP